MYHSYQIRVSLFFFYINQFIYLPTYLSFILGVCVYVCVCLLYMYVSLDNWWDSALSFHPLAPKHQTPVVSLGYKRLFSLSYLSVSKALLLLFILTLITSLELPLFLEPAMFGVNAPVEHILRGYINSSMAEGFTEWVTVEMNPEELPSDGTWGGLFPVRKEPTGSNGRACLYNQFTGAGMERGNMGILY